MSRSVSSAGRVQATFAATLVDELIDAGLRDVVISPGSRSTPLVLAVVNRRELTSHVRLDERSAGFFAIGRALATARPVAIVVTSGTAAAELHACVAEADRARVPLIVLTADRPPELHGVGAPQTIEQTHLYGSMVRSFEEPGVARAEASGSWRPLAQRLWRRAFGDGAPRGPVHANLAFVEPLVAEADELPERRRVAQGERVSARPVEPTTLDVAGRSVLCVSGPGVATEVLDECRALDWVVLGDATTRHSLSYFDALLRSDEFAEHVRPDVVVRLGGVPASKTLARRLREWEGPVVALDGAGEVADPDGVVGETRSGLPDRACAPLRANGDYVRRWRNASARVGEWLESFEVEDVRLNEPLVARNVVARSTLTRTPLVIGSSMPVRDVEWWGPPRREATFANRGANGIDGVVSTVMGVAAGERAIGLVGDVTMLHDVSGLVEGLGAVGGTCALVVVDNNGGGIFSFVDDATSLDPATFDTHFATPRIHRLEEVATAFGHSSVVVTTRDELGAALDVALALEGVSVIVAKVPSRADNVRVHDQWNSRVVELMSGRVE